MNLGLGGLPQLRRSVCPPFHGVKSYVAVHSVNGYFQNWASFKTPNFSENNRQNGFARLRLLFPRDF